MSRIRPRRKPRRTRPELFFKRKRDFQFLDSHSYVTKGGRVRLFGEDYLRLREAAYSRARSRNMSMYAPCECGCGLWAYWYPQGRSPADVGELSHNEHGPRKSDELDRVKWMRHECHMKSHNCGGKPVPAKERNA